MKKNIILTLSGISAIGAISCFLCGKYQMDHTHNDSAGSPYFIAGIIAIAIAVALLFLGSKLKSTDNSLQTETS